VLIVGIGGGVSMATLALARAMGATVYGTSRDESTRRRAIEAGAADVFASDGDWPVRCEVVVESVGPATWERSVAALVPGGRLVVCGGTSGPNVEVNLPRLFFKQHEIIGSTMGGYGEFAQVTRLVEQGLEVAVERELPLSAYPEALDLLRRGGFVGKIVLRHD
jgi:NADPH:quinone reductase-like Zn-dependent oxidoreductase